MEKILIINLRKIGDIFTTAHLVHSVKAKRPDAQISILVYKENIKAAKLLKNISQIFTIDRKKIVQFKKNRIYSKSLAVELLKDSLDQIDHTEWDHIVNFSNDSISCLLTSYLNSKNFVGLKFNNEMQVSYSNSWALLFNDVLTEFPYTPFHFNECYHKMFALEYQHDEIKIITDPHNNKIAYENFQKIKTVNENKAEIKIIGIQLKCGVAEKDIPKKVIIDLIHDLKDQKNFYPLILVAPIKEEIQLANEINQHFDNSLLSVEADLKAIPSVLINLDLLVTPDTSIKHLAELVNTPVIEISRGPSPFRKQGSINHGNLILRDHYNNISSTDILGTLLYYFKFFTKDDLILNNGVLLYENTKVAGSFIYKPLSGKFNQTFEISCLMSKYYIYKLFSNEQQDELLKIILNFANKNSIYEWINQEKEFMSSLVKKILSTIKALREIKVQGTYQNKFVSELEELLALCSEKVVASIPVQLFRGKLESLEKSSFEQNIRDLEKLLFELKNNLQLFTIAITNLTSYEFKIRKGQERDIQEISL